MATRLQSSPRGVDRRPRRRPPLARPCPGCGADLRLTRPVVPEWLGLPVRTCTGCGLGVVERARSSWPEARHLFIRLLVSARLALGTVLLLGLSFACAGIAHGVGIEMLARTSLATGVAAAGLVVGSGLFAGVFTTAVLAHRRPWEAGLAIALGIMFTSVFLSSTSDWTPPSIAVMARVQVMAAAIGLVALITATPATWFLRFLGRFDHLLPWRAR